MMATQSREHSVVRDRLAELFRDQKTRAGVLARRLLRTEVPGDAALAELLIRERRTKTPMDGSIDGGLLPTASVPPPLLPLRTRRPGPCSRGGGGQGRRTGPGPPRAASPPGGGPGRGRTGATACTGT